MSPNPDSQSLTRFLVWAGAFLVVASFAVPTLVLRDAGLLTISERDLGGLTPVAKEEIERRQKIARDVGEAAPGIGIALFVVGTFLLILGIPRLRHQEQGDEERREMERDKLRLETRPQSAEERRERLQEDVVEGEEGELVPPEPMLEPPSQESPQRRMAERLHAAADAEDAVLARIAEITPPHYDLQPKVAVSDGEGTLFLDALLMSEIDQLPDIVVEIKYLPRKIADAGRRVREGKQQLLHFLARYGRRSNGWLIVVAAAKVEDPKPIAEGDWNDDLTQVSIVGLDDLDQLKFPV